MVNIKEGYKQTEIGVIPEDWTLEELKNLTTKITDGAHKTPKYTEDGIPFLRVTDIQKQEIDWDNVKYISKEEHNTLIKRCNPEKGDILYSKNGTIGIPRIIDWDKEFSIFVSLCLIKLKKGLVNTKYLEQFLKSDCCLNQIKLRAKQGTVTNLHLEEIRELLIPLPNEEEQQKIAEILTTTDEHIEKLVNIIKDYQLLKKGMMKKLLTEGIGHTEFKETEIGRIPKEWEFVQLADIADVKGGKRLPKGYSLLDYNTGFPYIRVADMYQGGISTCEIKYVPIEIINTIQNYTISEDDLFISVAGTLGIVGIVPSTLNNANLTENANKICNIKCNKVFLMYYLMGIRIQNIIQDEKTTNAQPKLALSRIKKFPVTLPSDEEQQQIASILSEIDYRIELYQKQREDFAQLKKGLMEKLLTGKIRVNQ